MKKPNVAPKKITSKFPKPDLSDKDIAVTDGDVPPPKKEGGPVPTPDYTLEQLLANIPKPDLSDKDNAVADGDIPPPKKEGGPVPTPDYTLEQLLANIPKPDPKMSKSKSSKEVDTGKSIGKEVW